VPHCFGAQRLTVMPWPPVCLASCLALLLHRYLLAAATAEQHDEQQALCDDTHMSGFRSTLMQVLEAVSQVSRTAWGCWLHQSCC
jgi:hypothetical protein